MALAASQRNSDIWLDASRIEIFDDAPDGRLGTGSFGSVFRGTLDGSNVAIKQMNHGSKDECSQFEREIRRYKFLRSPHIVQFLGLSCRPGHPAGWLLVQDLMDGGSVYDALRHLKAETAARPPTARRCLLANIDLVKMAWHTSLGVRYLHQERLTHGDIKPQNVLMTEPLAGIRPNGDGFLAPNVRVKLTDFGLSRSYNEAVQTIVAGRLDTVYGPVGTFAYLAPEAIPGIRGFEAARAADIYSLGVLFFEMASCARPWEGCTIPQISHLVQVEAARPVWLGDETLPHKFKDLIRDCWDQDPNTRPSAAYISTQLEEIYRQLCPPTPPPEPEVIEELRDPTPHSSHTTTQDPSHSTDGTNVDFDPSETPPTPATIHLSASGSEADFCPGYPSPQSLGSLSVVPDDVSSDSSPLKGMDHGPSPRPYSPQQYTTVGTQAPRSKAGGQAGGIAKEPPPSEDKPNRHLHPAPRTHPLVPYPPRQPDVPSTRIYKSPHTAEVTDDDIADFVEEDVKSLVSAGYTSNLPRRAE